MSGTISVWERSVIEESAKGDPKEIVVETQVTVMLGLLVSETKDLLMTPLVKYQFRLEDSVLKTLSVRWITSVLLKNQMIG